MPIYAYRCEACGFAKDVLQKMSDDPLTVCPECQQPSFKKQVTAAGFQLKGSGWYVTDFRGGNKTGETASTSSTGANVSASPSSHSDNAGNTSAAAGSNGSTASSSSESTPAASNSGAGSGGDNKAA